MNKISLLVVDDETRFLETISKLLERREFEVTAVTSGEAAIREAREKEYDIALVDLQMPGMDGEQVLEKLKEQHPDMEVIILTGHGSVESTIRTTKLGGFSYLYKPCELDTLMHVFTEAYKSRLRRKFEKKIEDLEKIVAQATAQNAFDVLQKLIDIEKEVVRDNSQPNH